MSEPEQVNGEASAPQPCGDGCGECVKLRQARHAASLAARRAMVQGAAAAFSAAVVLAAVVAAVVLARRPGAGDAGEAPPDRPLVLHPVTILRTGERV